MEWRDTTKLELESHNNSIMERWELNAARKSSQEVYEKFFPALQEKVLTAVAAKSLEFQSEIVACWYIESLQSIAAVARNPCTVDGN